MPSMADIVIHVEYLPGVENVTADWESCHHNDSSNWQLSPAVFNAMNQLLGPFLHRPIRIQGQLSVADLLQLETRPWSDICRCLSMSWWNDSPYLFPLFCLMADGRALLKIQRELVNRACLIAPIWPGQIWYSQLLTVLADYPILLPQFPELLLSPDQKLHPLLLKEKLFLTARPISGKVMRC